MAPTLTCVRVTGGAYGSRRSTYPAASVVEIDDIRGKLEIVRDAGQGAG